MPIPSYSIPAHRSAARPFRSARPAEPRVSIVVPARNEAQNLRAVLPELPPVHEVILVDGHSVDDTVAVAREVMPDIRVLQQTRKGKGNALVCGFAAATGDIVVMFDADGSADPAEIPMFISTLTTGADFAKGSRFCLGGGSDDITGLRRAGNWALNAVTNQLFRTRFSDLCYGYNAFWRDIVGHLDLPEHTVTGGVETMLWGDGFEIETLLNCRVAVAQLVIREVPSVERPRIFGESNLHAVKDGLRVLKTIDTERRRARRAARSTPPTVDRTIWLTVDNTHQVRRATVSQLAGHDHVLLSESA